MNDTNGRKSEHALQLALSYLEKARLLSRECQEAHRAGRIKEPEYRSLQEFYARHLHRAQERVDTLHQEHRRRADVLRGEVQDAARRQAELGDLAAARDIAPRKANRLNRRIASEIEDARAQFRLEELLSSVQDPKELGGFIDLPLDKYLEAPKQTGLTSTGLDRLMATAAAVMGSLSVFMPWLSVAGDVRPLPGVPSLLGLEQRLGPSVVTAVFLLFLVWPLAGAVFAWVENPRRSGAGMAAVGVGMAVLTALSLLVATLLSGGQVFLSELVTGLRVGVILYLMSAMLLAMLGMRRARAEHPSPRRGGARLAFAGLLAAAAILAIVIYITTGTGHARLQFRFASPDPVTGTIVIAVTNAGTEQANLYVPWPEGGPAITETEKQANTFGLSLYVNEPGADQFRLYPDSQDCWLNNGRAIPADEPIAILPDSSIMLTLQPNAARQGGVNPKSVRIVAQDFRDQPLDSYQADLPRTAAP